MNWLRFFFLSIFFFLNISRLEAATECKSLIAIQSSVKNRIQVDLSGTLREIKPYFFGFNVEWLEFQNELWDKNSKQVLFGLNSIFHKFPGAIYRFPGGTNSNHFDWSESTGANEIRPLRRQVPWRGPLRIDFGLDEYLQFVKNVNGQVWYVTNLYGSLDSKKSINNLADSASSLAKYIQKRESEGLPSVFRWELGNELDRDRYKWLPEEVAANALPVANAIKQVIPSANFVHFQQEYPARLDRGYSSQRYNKELRTKLAELKPELAMHFYYDGPPDAPPVNYFLNQLCQVIDGAKAEGGNANIWITEHARVPNGFWTGTPKQLWPETANLAAAISIADMLIALSQIPEVKGAIAHALVGSNSPWPMIHVRANRTIEPSVPLLAMAMLRGGLLPEVVPIKQSSIGGGLFGAGYSVRGSVLTDHLRKNISLWVVNKSSDEQFLDFEISGYKNNLRFLNSKTIFNFQAGASNYGLSSSLKVQENYMEVTAVKSGLWKIKLPPNSISVISFVGDVN